MAALIEEATDPRQGTGTTGIPSSDPLTQGLYGQAATPARFDSIPGSTKVADAITSRMPDLVKGAGFARKGGNTPLTDYTDIMTRSAQASLDVRMSTFQGFRNKSATVNSLSRSFLEQHGAFATALMQPSVMDQVSELVSMLPGGGEAVKNYVSKSFTAGNLGIGSVSGLTPFNLLAPSRLG